MPKRQQPKDITPPRETLFKWDATKEQALWLIFEGKLSYEQVAQNVAVASRTVDRWVAHPAFQLRLQQMRADLAESMRGVIYSSKESRVVALADMAQKARREFEKRPWLKEVRPTRDGEVTNESFNEGAFGAFRGALDDIAKELGDRGKKLDVSGGVNVNLRALFVMPEVTEDEPPVLAIPAAEDAPHFADDDDGDA